MKAYGQHRRKPRTYMERRKRVETLPPVEERRAWFDPKTTTALGALPTTAVNRTVVPEWMARQGIFVVDRGYPVVHWVCRMVVGNHAMYKNMNKIGGFPYHLAHDWRRMTWKAGGYLGLSAIQVPGYKDIWWIPEWYREKYTAKMGRIWDLFAMSIYDVCVGHPKRYDGLKEAHRRWYVRPWVKSMLALHYPQHHVLTAMGFRADRDALIEELADAAMVNYPTREELMSAVSVSRPWMFRIDADSPDRPLPNQACSAAKNFKGWTTGSWRDYPILDPHRTNKMALDAADHTWSYLGLKLEKLAGWLSTSERLNRYMPSRPIATIDAVRRTVDELAAWMGPAYDKNLVADLRNVLTDFRNAPTVLNKCAPDNPWRPYYRHRINWLLNIFRHPDYQAKVLEWWRTGNVAAAPQSAPSPVWQRPPR